MRSICIALLVGSTVLSAGAAEEPIGWPTTGDVFRKSLNNAIRAGIEYKQNAGRFEVDLSKARTAYFTASMWSGKSAREELARLLFAKDIMLGMLYIPNGFGEYSSGINRMFAALNNHREIDGGIRSPARQAFNEWILSMRQSLGARGDNDVVFLTPDKMEQALLASADSYEKYRQQRDLAEVRSWRNAHPKPDEVVGKRRFRESKIKDIIGARPSAFDGGSAYLRAMTDAHDAGAKWLACRYGPSFDESGAERFGEIVFWKDKPPKNIASIVLLRGDPKAALQDQALSTCPSTEGEAIAALSVPAKFAVTPDVQEHVRLEQEKDKAIQAEKDRQSRQRTEAYAEQARQRREDDAKARAEDERVNGTPGQRFRARLEADRQAAEANRPPVAPPVRTAVARAPEKSTHHCVLDFQKANKADRAAAKSALDACLRAGGR